MNTNKNILRGSIHQTLMICALALGFAACSNNDGAPGAAGAPGPGSVASKSAATALKITVTSVSINSAPVVNFRVTNQDNTPVTGLDLNDLRFTIAKLTPGSNGTQSAWQNYINTASSGLTGGYVRGNREGGTTGSLIGTLVDHQDGTYTYTFKTNITDPAQTCPVAPCVDADGNTLNTSYNASLTHRVAIQTRGTLPMVNGIYTFRPSDGATTGLFTRDVVTTAKCNECHNKLVAHDARIDTQYCVMCHNPGSTAKGQVGTVTGPTPVDFKVMIHKLHHGDALPSVLGPDGTLNTADDGDYGIFGFNGTLTSFKDVAFPQDIRNCTKCHDGTVGAPNATAQGDNWKNQPGKAACSSCHDDVYFGTSPVKPYQTVSHITVSGNTAPADPTDDMCATCHGNGKTADVVAKHTNPLKVAGAKYKFNLISVTGGNTPSIQFSVTDPTNADAPYDIAAGDATSNPVFKTPSTSRLAIDIGWSTTDFANNTSGANPAQPISIDPVNACDGTPIADWTCFPNSPSTGVYTLTKSTALPAGAVGTGRVGFEGHPAAADPATGLYTLRVPVKSVIKDWSIDGSAVKARRMVVDIAKCDKCHDQLSLHGNNRTDEPQLCVICHNPNDTDASRRPKTAAGILSGVTVDGKLEESIDFKRMIHGIHGAGIREKGIVVYGFGGTANDFSNVRFPGILKDCTTCHTTSSYQLTGIWQSPTENGILASTISTTPTATDATSFAAQLATPDDDLNITPTAAVCSSCHDGDQVKQHMLQNGANFADTQTNITSHLNSYETCPVCHGPGREADVKVMHGVP